MNKYITKTGQNLYDVALAIYGSIEGIFDLLISNQNISISTVFSKGTELVYHEDFVLNDDISQWLKDNDISVKNGNYKITNTDIKDEIKNWLTKTNSQKFTFTDNIYDTPNGTMKPDLWKNDGETAISSNVDDTKWGKQTISASIIKADLPNSIHSQFNIDIREIDDEEKVKILNKLYSQGMIIIPFKKDDKEEYYTNMASPKIKIIQAGKTSAINFQIPANNFIAIDWGDGNKMDFYHYQQETIRAAHNYEDDGEHTIILYGNSEFTNLDFTELNGVYYALTTIYVNKQFVTPYDKDNPINNLFITK